MTKQSLENILASPNDQKYTRYPLVFKVNATLARPLRLVIPHFLNGNSCQMIGACIFMTANETRSDGDGFIHTKQLLNLLCIVYLKKVYFQKELFGGILAVYSNFNRNSVSKQ